MSLLRFVPSLIQRLFYCCLLGPVDQRRSDWELLTEEAVRGAVRSGYIWEEMLYTAVALYHTTTAAHAQHAQRVQATLAATAAAAAKAQAAAVAAGGSSGSASVGPAVAPDADALAAAPALPGLSDYLLEFVSMEER